MLVTKYKSCLLLIVIITLQIQGLISYIPTYHSFDNHNKLQVSFIRSYYNHRIIKNSMKLAALKPGVLEKLEEIHLEYKNLENQLVGDDNIDVTNRRKELSVIIKSFDALQQINNDIELFNEQIDSTDESIRESAKLFKKEFIQCKDEIEKELNNIL